MVSTGHMTMVRWSLRTVVRTCHMTIGRRALRTVVRTCHRTMVRRAPALESPLSRAPWDHYGALSVTSVFCVHDPRLSVCMLL